MKLGTKILITLRAAEQWEIEQEMAAANAAAS
jgi:hypothetical protein